MPYRRFTCRRSRPERISSIGNAAGSRSSSSSRSPARAICAVCSSPSQSSGEVGQMFPITRPTSRAAPGARTPSEEVGVVAARGRTRVLALLEGHEVGRRARRARLTMTQRFAKPPHEHRVAGAEKVDGRLGELRQCDHERGRGLAPVRASRFGVEEVEDDRDLGTGRGDLGVTLVEHRAAEPLREPAHALALGLATPRERPRHHAGTHRAHPQARSLHLADLTRSRSRGPEA